jgi:hypothetical protein
LRLSVPSASNNGFPSFAGDKSVEAAEVKLFVNAMRTEGNYSGCSFQETALQRAAATNPVATSMFHHQLITSVHEKLMGLPGMISSRTLVLCLS